MFVLGFLALVAIGAVLSLVEIALIELDRYGWSAFVAALSIAGSYYLIDGVADWVNTVGWENLAIHVAGFIGIGVGVAFLKWMRSVHKFSRGLAGLKEDFTIRVRDTDNSSVSVFKEVPFDKNDSEHLMAFYDKVKSTDGYSYPELRAGLKALPKTPKLGIKSFDNLVIALTPRALNASDRIASWIFTWPFVVAHTILADVFIKLGRHLARLIDWAFGRVSRLIVANGLK